MAVNASLIGSRGTTTGSTVTTTAGTSTGGSGNHGVLVVSFDPGVTVSGSITDSKSNAFTLQGSTQNDASEGKLAVYVSLNWTGGATHSVSVNFSGSAFAVAHLIEVTGAASSTPIDVDVAETDAAQPCSANSGTLAQAAEVVLICGCCNEISGDGEYTTTTGTILSSEPSVTSFWTSGVAKLVTSATTDTAYDIRRNAPTTSGGGHIRLVSFKEAAGGTDFTIAGGIAVSGTVALAGNAALGIGLSTALSVAGTVATAGDVGWGIELDAPVNLDVSGSLATAGDLGLVISLSGGVSTSGTLALTGAVGLEIGLQTALSVSGTIATAGDIGWGIDLVTSSGVSVAGTVSLAGEFAYFGLFDLETTGIAVSGTVSVAGDVLASIEFPVEDAALSVAGTVALAGDVGLGIGLESSVAVAGTVATAGDLAVVVGIDTALAVSGSIALTGDVAYEEDGFTLTPTAALAVSGAVSVAGDVGRGIGIEGELAVSGSVSLAGDVESSEEAARTADGAGGKQKRRRRLYLGPEEQPEEPKPTPRPTQPPAIEVPASPPEVPQPTAEPVIAKAIKPRARPKQPFAPAAAVEAVAVDPSVVLAEAEERARRARVERNNRAAMAAAELLLMDD